MQDKGCGLMSRFDFSVPDELLEQLGRMADIEEAAPEMLAGAAPILEDRLRQELAKHRDTGALVGSIKVSKPKRDARSGDWYITVGPTGKDPVTGERNMEKLAILEYGSSTQPPRPMMDRIKADVEPAVIRKMEEIFYEVVGIR